MDASSAPASLGARLFAWLGGALFCLALLYFLFSYMVTFGETAPETATAESALLNVALFSAFALHHSVFAREPIRRRVARIVPASLERAAYVWVASVLLIVTCALWQPVPGTAWRIGFPGAGLVYLVQVGGFALTAQSAAIIDALDLAGIRQVSRRLPMAPHDAFKTDGPYGWVRHPIYSGWFLIVFATPVMTMTRLVFAVVSSAYVLLAIPLEERSLRASSGGSYEDYSRRVKWRLIPRVY